MSITKLRQKLVQAREEAYKDGCDWESTMTEYGMALMSMFPEQYLEGHEMRLRLNERGFMFMLVKINPDDKVEEGYDVC